MVRSGRSADNIECVLDIGDPVAQRLVHCVLKFRGAGRDRHDLGAQQLHAEDIRSEEHTSELQSLMRSSYAVFCLKKKKEQALQQIPNTRYNYQPQYQKPLNY